MYDETAKKQISTEEINLSK